MRLRLTAQSLVSIAQPLAVPEGDTRTPFNEAVLVGLSDTLSGEVGRAKMTVVQELATVVAGSAATAALLSSGYSLWASEHLRHIRSHLETFGRTSGGDRGAPRPAVVALRNLGNHAM